VNEDEGFIRAMVDSPGDDTARLVYADWLDDRDDPRGPYLRAEREWGRFDPRSRKRAPAEKKLRALARMIDPVRTARVSRPPVGVCCDGIRFQDAQPAVRVAELDAVEHRLKLLLPVELRALLLNQNGGKPEPNGYSAPRSKPDDLPHFVDQFFSVSSAPTQDKRIPAAERMRRELCALEHTTKVLNNGFVARTTDPAAHQKWVSGEREFVTFAGPDGGARLGVLAIGLTGRRAGKVYALNRTLLCTSSSPRLLADSLSQFLTMITFSLDDLTSVHGKL